MQEIKNIIKILYCKYIFVYIIYKNIFAVLLNKNYLILFNGKNEIWHMKNAHVPDLLYAPSICAI